MRFLYKLLIGSLILLLPLILVSQDANIDSTESPKTKKVDLLPAISYTPETQLTLGVIGYYYMDFSKGNPQTTQSNVNFLGIYTTANQILIEGTWDIFTSGDEYRFRGKAFYNKYPDRNYGMGNDAGLLVVEVEGEGEPGNTLNYLRYDSKRLTARPVFLKRIANNLYAGLQFEFESLYDYDPLPDQYYFPNPGDSIELSEMPVEALIGGGGIQILYDSRDNLLNPLRGNYFEAGNRMYRNWLGSDYTFTSYKLDLRQYLNPFRNHTLALRGYWNLRSSPEGERIPIRALSRVGGYDFIRGYFFGTYQDNNLLAFETEYRMPFWPEDTEATLWKFWKRLGIVGFLSGAQVYGETDDFALDRFRLAAGGGLRVLFNRQSRVNIRIDYALGLSPDSGGPGKRQSGLYFYLSEAF